MQCGAQVTVVFDFILFSWAYMLILKNAAIETVQKFLQRVMLPRYTYRLNTQE